MKEMSYFTEAFTSTDSFSQWPVQGNIIPGICSGLLTTTTSVTGSSFIT